MRANGLAIILVVLAACQGADRSRPESPSPIRFAEGTALDAGGKAVLDFGTVAPGRQARRVVVVENVSDRPLDLVLEEPRPPFFVVDAPERIAAGSPASLVFRYAPEDEGEAEQAISLAAGDGRLGIRLAGRAERANTGCEVRVEPEALRLGAGTEGVALPWTFPLAVEVAKGRCALEEVRGEGELEFALDDLPGKVLLAGNRYVAALHVGPAAAGASGTLVLDFGERELRVPVVIASGSRCVSLETEELAFVEGYRCERTMNIPLNVACEGPVELLAARLVPEGASRWFSVAAGPQEIAVTYWADDLMETARALLVLDYDNGDRVHLALEGRVTVAEQRVTVPSIPIDVLVLVDKTPAAQALDVALDHVVSRIVRWLASTDLDARLAATTTLYDDQEGCEAEAGRLLPLDGSRPAVLSRDMPDFEEVLRANLAVERCAPPGTSRGLEAAIAALQPGEEGWTRVGAKRAVVAVVAEDDSSSPILRTSYLTRLRQVDVFRFFVVGPDPSCGDEWNFPLNYEWIAGELDGFHQPFCVPSPGESIPFELDAIGPAFHQFALDVQADVLSEFADETDGILLLYDGDPVPSSGTPMLPGWTVAEQGKTLRLHRGYPPSAELVLRYPPQGSACRH